MSKLFDMLKMPPKEALASIRKRGGNLVTSQKWDELDQKAHDKAFTVAGVMKADILQTIYDHVERAKKNGWSLATFQKALMPLLEKSGWTGANPSRLRVIYETNMRLARAQEQYKKFKLIAQFKPYWKYVQTQRANKRHDHSNYDGKVFRHDDPIWAQIYPPSGFNCNCKVVPLTEKEMTAQNLKVTDGSTIKVNADNVQINPLKEWEPRTDKYVKKIGEQLKASLKTVKKAEEKKADKVDPERELAKDETVKMLQDSSKKFTPMRAEEGYSQAEPLNVIAKIRGYDGKPVVVGKAEFNKITQDSKAIVYRGLAEKRFCDGFQYGDYFAGTGIHGAGTYTAVKKDTAFEYAKKYDKVLKIAIPKTAKTIERDDLKKLKEQYFAKEFANMDKAIKEKTGIDKNQVSELMRDWLWLRDEVPEATKQAAKEKYLKINAIYENAKNEMFPLATPLEDLGVFAAHNGYDAYFVESSNYWVILNRSILIVQKEHEGQ